MKVWIGLGANLGEPQAAIATALREIAAMPCMVLQRASSVYRSAPVEAQGPDFYNAVAEIETTMAPIELLHALQAIEQAHGRERPYRNAPRTLDLDLLFYGEMVLEQAGLSLPHPRLHLRAFVLEPLLELSPGHVHPLLGLLAPWRTRAESQAIERLS